MATILDFPEMQMTPRRRTACRGTSTGEVILFPGVRYERWGEAPREHEVRPATIVRDRLQLVE